MSQSRFHLFVLPFLACILCVAPLSVWADDTDPLRIGIFPRRTAAVTERMFAPLADYLSRQLGRPVVVETSHDFRSFWQQVKARAFDVVHYNQYHYVKSHAEQGYEVILKNEEFGESKIAGALLARRDAGIDTVADLKGKKVVFGGGRGAMQSYIVATYLLRRAGLHDGDYFELFALTPPKAAIAVFYRQASAAGIGARILELPRVTKQVDTGQLAYLAKGKPLAHLPWAVHPDLDAPTVLALQRNLVALKDSPSGRRLLKSAALTGLIPADDGEYDAHRLIIHEVLGEAY